MLVLLLISHAAPGGSEHFPLPQRQHSATLHAPHDTRYPTLYLFVYRRHILRRVYFQGQNTMEHRRKRRTRMMYVFQDSRVTRIRIVRVEAGSRTEDYIELLPVI